MIKLMGNKGGHLPVQLAGGGASGSGTNVKATFVKTSGDQVMFMFENFKIFHYIITCFIQTKIVWNSGLSRLTNESVPFFVDIDCSQDSQ